MRRRAGVGAIQQHRLTAERYKEKVANLQETQLELLNSQMEVFRAKLEEFVLKHKEEIRKSSEFRKHFQNMCSAIGVDPLASGKGFWSILGVSDFYYELGVQVVEVCLAANRKTGGLMELNELRCRLLSSRGQSIVHQEITNDDILMAAKNLSIFGNGFIVHKMGKNKYIVQSIPQELSMEESSILNAASNTDNGNVTQSLLIKKFGWTTFHANQCLEKVVGEGLCWIDTQCSEPCYWFPSLYPGRT